MGNHLTPLTESPTQREAADKSAAVFPKLRSKSIFMNAALSLFASVAPWNVKTQTRCCLRGEVSDCTVRISKSISESMWYASRVNFSLASAFSAQRARTQSHLTR